MPMYPYGVPADPSQPMPPYGQPGAPSMPMYPYGQPGGPSMPMYPYGMPGAPSQGFPTMAPAQPKKSHKKLWISLAVVTVLLAASGGGVAFALQQLSAPANAAIQFCANLKSQNYDAAYDMLTAKMQGQYTHQQFSQGSQVLDTAEGQVTGCKPSTSGNAYQYSLGASTATVSAVIDRNTQGSLSGALHLKNENGWKIDAIDTSLLGVNLTSLQTVQGFCAAMISKNYTSAYSYLGSALTSQSSTALFTSATGLWDLVDGPVTACNLTTIATSNTDTATTLGASVTRSTRGAQSGSISLDVEGGSWKISSIDQSLLGTDLAPLDTINQFCGYLKANHLDSAYNLLSSGIKQDISKSQFESLDYFGMPAGVKWTTCQPRLSTYKIQSGEASVDTDLRIAGTYQGIPINQSLALTFFAIQEGTSWKVDGWKAVK
jgi:hypothetical protein